MMLYKSANFIRQKFLDNGCCVHGIIEFSNTCVCQCAYCGINSENSTLKRFSLNTGEILEVVEDAVKRFGFKGIVLQSGEDPSYRSEDLLDLIKKIRENYPVFIFLSVGERMKSFIEKRLMRVPRLSYLDLKHLTVVYIQSCTLIHL